MTQAEYLSALRGAHIEVHSGSGTAAGRLRNVVSLRNESDDLKMQETRARSELDRTIMEVSVEEGF